MSNITTLIDKEDWAGVDMNAHILKTSSGTVGAGKLHYACFYMQDAYAQNDFQAMLNQCYPLLVEAAIEIKRYAGKFTSEWQGQDYKEELHELQIPIATLFS